LTVLAGDYPANGGPPVRLGIRAAVPAVPRPANWRWNFLVFGGDIAFFTFGLNISSALTILPLFVNHLTPSNVAVALIAAVRNLGLYAPQLLVAPRVERLRHALPFILVVTIFERIPFLFLALCAFWLSGTSPTLLLVVFFLLLLMQQGAGGLTYPPWLDLIARTIPSDWRGRFMGLWTGIGGIGGIAGAALGALLIARLAWPNDFAVIFSLTFATMVVSFVLLALGREPPRATDLSPQAPSPARGGEPEAIISGTPSPAHGGKGWGVGATVREQWALLRADRPLQYLVAANALMGIATMAGALFAISALRLGGLNPPEVGALSTVLIIASTAGYFLWGTLGDRLGHRSVLIGTALCAAGAAAVALVAHGVAAYGMVFLLLGLHLSALVISQLTFITEFAPPARRPTYIALTSVAYAPFAVGAPILGGWLADRWGYVPVFVIAIAAGLAAAALYRLRVPRSRAYDAAPA
jgi:MFS family permease